MKIIPTWVGVLILLTIAVGILLIPSGDESRPSSRASLAPPRVVDYVVVWEHRHPNGSGYTKFIVIDSVHATEAHLRALGEQLRFDTRDVRNAILHVYSHRRAAAMFHDLDRASKKDLAFYDRHFVAAYTRNASTGFHHFSFSSKGLSGPQTEITY